MGKAVYKDDIRIIVVYIESLKDYLNSALIWDFNGAGVAYSIWREFFPVGGEQFYLNLHGICVEFMEG